MHSSQSVEEVLRRGVGPAFISDSEGLVFVESSNFLNLLILPLSEYFAQQLLCQCSSSAFFLLIETQYPVDCFCVDGPCVLIFVVFQMIPSMNASLALSLNRISFSDSWHIIHSRNETGGEDRFKLVRSSNIYNHVISQHNQLWSSPS